MALDVAAGMIFVYLLLSLMASAGMEMIAAVLKLRGRQLQAGILTLVAGDASKPDDVVSRVYAHPLVRALRQGPNGPSYIPSRTFVLALLDTLQIASAADAQKVVAALGDTHLAVTLRVLLQESHQEIETFKTNLEVWFNNGMDRVSGWYKRRTQGIMLGIAALLAVGLNADSLVIYRALASDPSLRNALVEEAKVYAAQPPGADASTVSAAAQHLEEIHRTIGTLGLPLGWARWPARATLADPGRPHDPEVNAWPGWRMHDRSASDWSWHWWRVVRFHFFGWLLTALAMSLGAPFWFDLLNKIVAIRSSGKAPEEEPKLPKVLPLPAAPGAP